MKENLPVVAIVGAGFGGLSAAKALKDAPVKVILLDRNNYHLFQPLLYQVATAGLSPNDIAYPVRSIFRKQRNLEFHMADVTSINFNLHRLQTATGPVDYDYLILSPGSETNYFGMQSVKRNGYSLKELPDAEAIRNHILRMVEQSTREEDGEKCNALRTFVIVGGGPTGVECAGAISELIRLVLQKDYPALDVSDIHVILLEMTDHLLNGFPNDLGRYAQETLVKKGVEVCCNNAVREYDGQKVLLKSGEVIPTNTLIWAAGVKGAELLNTLDIPLAKNGRVQVENTLQLPGQPDVFVIGDAAYLEENGVPLPMMAPVAIQQAKAAAKNISNRMAGRPLEQFQYKNPGMLATIGRNSAVAFVHGIKFHGLVAWFVWLSVHLVWLISFRNRLFVLTDWAWNYFLYESAVRLILPEKGPDPNIPIDRQRKAITLQV